MLHIDKGCLVRLNKAGFIRPYSGDGPSPYDFYDFNGNEWSLGGQLTKQSSILAPREVYEQGTLLPTITDLMNWLENEGFMFSITFNGNGYRVMAQDKGGTEYKGKGGTLPYALTSIVEKLLLSR
ncbi:hypothetical protein [Saccharibacillus sp. O23]|uniref:hypothetical protein n=1 Tax=Saccharibacillus sp. O23 TaxID=2009338 RepID=UPI00117A1752|nr:hypothetical protein [Saccharibacillus sp. O23]